MYVRFIEEETMSTKMKINKKIKDGKQWNGILKKEDFAHTNKRKVAIYTRK